jgi:hypothetical protein
VYVGRDDTGSCLFDMHRGATGSTCGPGPIAFKTMTSVDGDEQVGAVVVPDGMKVRVYEGRATEMRKLENLVAVAFSGPLTLRVEGQGRRKDVRFSG